MPHMIPSMTLGTHHPMAMSNIGMHQPLIISQPAM
jgi:hypothetical protein